MKTSNEVQPNQYISVEIGVMVMKNNKAWGVEYEDGRSTSYGWIDPACAEISNPDYCLKPTSVTYKGSPYEKELSTACLVKVERKTVLTVLL